MGQGNGGGYSITVVVKQTLTVSHYNEAVKFNSLSAYFF